ncbi:MAG: hypothetical protein WAM95_00350 [Bacillus sp. (in: firmicutes)]
MKKNVSSKKENLSSDQTLNDLIVQFQEQQVNLPSNNVDMPSKKVEETLNNLIEQFQEQDSKLNELYSQIQQHQELLNEVLRETKKDPLPHLSSKSLLSILEKFKLDTGQLIQIATFIGSLYTNNNIEKQEQELTLEQLYNQLQRQQEILNKILKETGLLSTQPSFSLLEILKLDTKKLVQIAAFIGALYINNSEEEQD